VCLLEIVFLSSWFFVWRCWKSLTILNVYCEPQNCHNPLYIHRNLGVYSTWSSWLVTTKTKFLVLLWKQLPTVVVTPPPPRSWPIKSEIWPHYVVTLQSLDHWKDLQVKTTWLGRRRTLHDTDVPCRTKWWGQCHSLNKTVRGQSNNHGCYGFLSSREEWFKPGHAKDKVKSTLLVLSLPDEFQLAKFSCHGLSRPNYSHINIR
jgi:hypothetical protein